MKTKFRVVVVAAVAGALVAAGGVSAFAAVTPAALPAGPSTPGVTGSRPSATNLTFPISDRVQAKVDVATGNLMVSTNGLSLPGVNSSVAIGQTYNSMGFLQGIARTPAATGWSYGLDGAGSLTTSGSNPIYVGADGSTWKFTLSGSTYTPPAGLAATLTHDTTANTWTITNLRSGQVVVYDIDGNPKTITDKNGNIVTSTYTGGIPTALASTVGTAATIAQTAAFSYNSSTYLWTVTQALGSTTRSIQYQKDSTGVYITSFTDALGNATQFTYTGGKMTKIVSVTGAETDIAYNSAGQVSEVDQLNTTAGSPGTSTTRLTYPSSQQTLVAGPNTDTSVAVANGDHTTYDINSATELVNTATDPMGRKRSKTYNGNSLPLTSTSGTSGAAGTTTTTAQYGANSNQSLTSVASQGGTSTTATYNSTPAANAFNPASTTTDTGSGSSTSAFTYDGAGNQLTSGTTSGATTTVNATVTRNSDGTISSALSAGNGTNKTIYNWNARLLRSVTPVTGTALGTKTFGYDAFGRITSEADGRGPTTSYTYDNNDHLLTTSYSDSTPTVTSTFDNAGRTLTEASGPGTITNTYDQLGRLTSTVNTAGGGTISYGFDRASNETSMTTSYGTWTNAFDSSGELYLTKYPKGSSFQYTDYATDTQGRRTDMWLQGNGTYTPGSAVPPTWSGHQQTVYDTNGRVGEIKAFTGPASTNTPVFDTQYCYNSAATSSCSTATATDHSKVQWQKNILTGQLTQNTYTSNGRIQTVAQSGGSNGNTTWNYTYDARGNRLTAAATGSTTPQTLTYNAANQITTAGYTYDGAGNLTNTPTAVYTYNAAEQMLTSKNVSTGVVTSYTYSGSAQNRVLSESTPGDHTYNITYGQNDSQGQPEIAQYQVVTGATVSGNLYADPTTGQPLMLTTSSDIACLYINDGQSNPVGLLTDSAGNAISTTYDPYGVGSITGSGNGAGQNPYSFHSGIQDRASGLVKFGIRWYNPVTGTWTQQDTLDSPLDPTNGNRYIYVAGDPVNGLDPTGRDLLDILTCSTGIAFLPLGGVGSIAGAFGVATTCRQVVEQTAKCDAAISSDQQGTDRYLDPDYVQPCSNPFSDNIRG